MAHLGFARASLAFILITGCGGKYEDPGVQHDSGTDSELVDTGGLDRDTGARDDGPPPVTGFRSYTATIVSVDAKSTSGGGAPEPTGPSPSMGWIGRIDIAAGGTGETRAEIMAPFRDLVALKGCCGSSVTLTRGKESDAPLHFLSVSGPAAPYGARSDEYESLTVTFGSDGAPVAATARGRSRGTYPGTYYEAELTATIKLTPDTTKPTFRATASTAFASVSLPWDERVYEASEPYEGELSTKDLLGPAFTAKVKDTLLSQAGWSSAPRGRGVRFRLLEWDAASTWFAYTFGAPRDLAGNVAAVEPKSFPSVVDVPKLAGDVLRFDGPVSPLLWGDAKIVTTGCKSAAKCLQIGPYKQSYCQYGSAGGVAARFAGSGSARALVRAVGKRVSSYGGGGLPPGSAIQFGAVTPGSDVQHSSALPWHPTATPDAYDTGWSTVTATSAAGSETGVALSGGGLGKPSSGCGYGGPPAPTPAPIDYEVTTYVEEITLAK